MSKEREIQKLFEAVVDYEREPIPLHEQIMREQKRQCLIIWPQEARTTILRAKSFAQKHPLVP